MNKTKNYSLNILQRQLLIRALTSYHKKLTGKDNYLQSQGKPLENKEIRDEVKQLKLLFKRERELK